MLALADKAVDRLIGLSALIGALALIVVTVTILIDVVGRLFGAPLYGARDIVQMAAVIVVFGGMGYAQQRGGHIAVDILESRLGPGLNRWLVTVGMLAGAVVFALIAWQVQKATGLSRMLKMSTNILYIPRTPFEYAIATLSGLASLSLAIKALARVLGLAR